MAATVGRHGSCRDPIWLQRWRRVDAPGSRAEPGWLLSAERVTATDITSTEYDYDLGGNRTEQREVNMTGTIVSAQTYGYAWGNELTDVSGAAVTALPPMRRYSYCTCLVIAC